VIRKKRHLKKPVIEPITLLWKTLNTTLETVKETSKDLIRLTGGGEILEERKGQTRGAVRTRRPASLVMTKVSKRNSGTEVRPDWQHAIGQKEKTGEKSVPEIFLGAGEAPQQERKGENGRRKRDYETSHINSNFIIKEPELWSCSKKQNRTYLSRPTILRGGGKESESKTQALGSAKGAIKSVALGLPEGTGTQRRKGKGLDE